MAPATQARCPIQNPNHPETGCARRVQHPPTDRRSRGRPASSASRPTLLQPKESQHPPDPGPFPDESRWCYIAQSPIEVTAIDSRKQGRSRRNASTTGRPQSTGGEAGRGRPPIAAATSQPAGGRNRLRFSCAISVCPLGRRPRWSRGYRLSISLFAAKRG